MTILSRHAGTWLAAILLSSVVSPGARAEEESDADLAKAAQNPLANMVSLPFQNNTNFDTGPNNRTQNVLNIQPVIPFKNGEIITRTIIPLVWQPIGASDSIDIVRGPASPIFGPSKVGGYLDFHPKSERANADNTSDPRGDIGFEGGSWGKKVLHASVSGPMSLFDKPLGYSLYGESENSDSYYQNTHTIQDIAQASFDLKISDTWHSEFDPG